MEGGGVNETLHVHNDAPRSESLRLCLHETIQQRHEQLQRK